jgi:hypothetical protein
MTGTATVVKTKNFEPQSRTSRIKEGKKSSFDLKTFFDFFEFAVIFFIDSLGL